MERIPILKRGDVLLVTIQVDMHDRLALALQEDLTARISATSAHGVLIDISSLEVVDSFIGRMFANIAAMARVLDSVTVGEGSSDSSWSQTEFAVACASPSKTRVPESQT